MTADSSEPVRVSIIGMGGFAGAHHRAIQELEADGLARLVSTCDPNIGAFSKQCSEWRFEERGVQVYDDFQNMLAGDDSEMLIVPTPIPLHAEMHRAGVRAGRAVYLEKPPTLDPDELEEMCKDQAEAQFSTQVGFNYIIQPTRQWLKQRILDGDFGALREVRFLGAWARGDSYFCRNGWAGQLLTDDGRLLLDSCLGNAMAHFAHNALFWAGKGGIYDWGKPASVRAALFRAHAIEGPDTVLLEAALEEEVTLRMGLSHAYHGPTQSIEEFFCEKARIRWAGADGEVEIFWFDGRHEVVPAQEFRGLPENQKAYCQYLRGHCERPATRLPDTRPFVHLNALTYAAAKEIHNFSDNGVVVSTIRNPDGNTFRPVENLLPVLGRFIADGTWPSQWGTGLGENSVGPQDLGGVRQIVSAMRKSAAA